MTKPEIGQKQNKSLVADTEEFIDPGFFIIDIKINGKVFHKAVDGILTFESEDFSELTDDEIDKALVQCSYYRYTFLAAGAEVEARLSRVQRKYLTWFAEVSEDARREIMQERMDYKKEHKVPGSWFGSITKLEIEQRIATDPSTYKKYYKYDALVIKLKKQIKLLYGLRDILQDRGGHLQSIGRRKLENRKMTFGVSG